MSTPAKPTLNKNGTVSKSPAAANTSTASKDDPMEALKKLDTKTKTV